MESQATQDIRKLFNVYLEQLHPSYLDYIRVNDPQGTEKLFLDFAEDLANNMNSPNNLFNAVASNFMQAQIISFILGHQKLPSDEEYREIQRKSYKISIDSLCPTKTFGGRLCEYYKRVFDEDNIEKLVNNSKILERLKRHGDDLFTSLRGIWEDKWVQIKVE